jgi:Asp/Glu/hydantoin racemase
VKFQAAIGVLDLDLGPERIELPEDTPGYLRNNDTFDFPVKRETVRGATWEKLVMEPEKLTPSFIDAARNLEKRGVRAIAGNCGFMAIQQREIVKSVSVPVITSSLLLVPIVYRMLPENKRVGILTFDSEALSEKYFNGVGWSARDIPIALCGMNGLPKESRYPPIGAANLVNLARDLIRENVDLGAIILECTYMLPYSLAIQEATRLPVFDITTLIKMVHAAVEPPHYE